MIDRMIEVIEAHENSYCFIYLEMNTEIREYKVHNYKDEIYYFDLNGVKRVVKDLREWLNHKCLYSEIKDKSKRIVRNKI